MKIVILIIIITESLELRVRSRNDINDIDTYLVDKNDRVIDNFLNKEKKNDLEERINQMKSVSELKIEKDMMNDISEVIDEYLKGGSVFSIEYKEEEKKNNCNDIYTPKNVNEKKIKDLIKSESKIKKEEKPIESKKKKKAPIDIKKSKNTNKKDNEEKIIKKNRGKDSNPKNEKEALKQPEENNVNQPIEKELNQPEEKDENESIENKKEPIHENRNNQEELPVKENQDDDNNRGNLDDNEQLQQNNNTISTPSIQTSNPNTSYIIQSNHTRTTQQSDSSNSSLPMITISPNCTELSTSSSRSQLTHALESQKDQIINLRQKLISLYLRKKKTLHEPPLFTSSELNNPSTFLSSSSIKSQYEDE